MQKKEGSTLLSTLLSELPEIRQRWNAFKADVEHHIAKRQLVLRGYDDAYCKPIIHQYIDEICHLQGEQAEEYYEYFWSWPAYQSHRFFCWYYINCLSWLDKLKGWVFELVVRA